MRMKKIYLLLWVSLFTCSSFSLLCQEEEPLPLPKSLQQNRLFSDKRPTFLVGGNVGFQFGNYTFIDVSPHVGIYPFDFLCIGVGASYMYMRYNYYKQYNDSHIYGVKAFIEGYIWRLLVLHAEYEYINYKLNFYNMQTGKLTKSERVGTHAFLVGPGYKQPVTNKISLYCLLLFNLYEDNYSFFSNPVVRVGINVDL